MRRVLLFGLVLIASVSAQGCVGLSAALTAATIAAAAAKGGSPAASNETMLVFGGPGHKTFLGCLCDKSNPNSISNPYGSFGSAFSSTSIWNHFSDFGSAYSSYSACSTYANDPPIVVTANGQAVGRLTLNRYTPGAIQVAEVVSWLEASCKK